jgi:eukaryotic-like serine/threonine-protein kinase
MGQTNDPGSAGSEERLECAIAAYLADVAQGIVLDPEELLADHPDSAQELREFLQDHERVLQIARSLRSESEPASGSPGTPKQSTIQHSTPSGRAGTAPLQGFPQSLGQEPVRFGDYELLEEIARGGMGIVYKARQVSLNRIVAVKMILQGKLAAAEDVERFRIEAAAAAKLKHPHIVVIHEVGRTDGQDFFSMEYVEGRSLAELIRQGSIPPKHAAQTMRQVAEAVHFAHQNGVLHRDIKPSNVLIDQAGSARVMDFGLAKQVDRSQGLTLTGQIMGTPTYMAPEQITNRRGELGPACDVYGMGALFYELLTGLPPFQGRDQIDTLLAVLEFDPQSPRRLNPNVPRELEMICLKCLEKDLAHRYASAEAVADDLARYLAGDSISLSSPKLVDRLVRTLERSQYDQECHAWSRMLKHLAWIALVTHTLVYLNRALALPHPVEGLIAIRLLEIVGMGLVLWLLRRQWYPPRGAPARQLWSLGLGYMAGSTVLVVLTYLLTPAGAAFDDFLVYPPLAVLGSLLFIMLGSSYWGYCYVIGAVFLVLAIGMTFCLGFAPLMFGVAWGASLTMLGIRLDRLAGGG